MRTRVDGSPKTCILPSMSANTVSAIIERISLARKLRGLGSRELSRLAGLSPSAVSHIESKQTVDAADVEVGTLLRLAAALRVRPAWLLTGEGGIDLHPDGPVTIHDFQQNSSHGKKNE